MIAYYYLKFVNTIVIDDVLIYNVMKDTINKDNMIMRKPFTVTESNRQFIIEYINNKLAIPNKGWRVLENGQAIKDQWERFNPYQGDLIKFIKETVLAELEPRDAKVKWINFTQAISAKVRRKASQYSGVVTITLDRETHIMLKELADSKAITLSEQVNDSIKVEYKQLIS